MATEKRLIDAVNVECALIAICARESGIPLAVAEWLSGVIRNAPTVDAVEVVHGRWNPCGSCGYRCSKCDFWVAFRSLNNYCPNCGAKMDGDVNG